MKDIRNKIVVICGPTATGKTSLGLRLCQKLGGEIVSIDSRQVYKELEIGTGKKPLREFKIQNSKFTIKRKDGLWIINGVKTHLYDLISPDEELNAVQYARLAADRIEKIWSHGKQPFLVGGAGLYLEILLGMVEVAKVPKNPKLRKKLRRLSQDELVAKLEEIDPARVETIDKNSPHRVMRAIEIALGTESGTRNSEFVEVLPEDIDPLWIGLNAPRKYLYDKIDQRVDHMVEAGLLKEVENLVKKYGWDAPALDSIGYAEFKKYFQGEKSLEEQIQRVKYNTHAYARRQLTWFRRNDAINWLDITDEDFEQEAEKMVESYLRR